MSKEQTTKKSPPQNKPNDSTTKKSSGIRWTSYDKKPYPTRK